VQLDDAAFGHVRESAYAMIVERAGKLYVDVPLLDPSAPLSCPECDAPMSRTELDDIPIDYCRDHGTWFDAQELLAVALALHRKKLANQHREEPPSVGADLLPYARSVETAEQLAALQARLRGSVKRMETIQLLKKIGIGRRW
jgi:Zn-finger nucleic acid-binding protein